MVFEHIWRDPDFNINNGKQWNPFSDNITAQDMNYIVSNLNYVADNIGAFTENAEEAVRIASDASNLSIQASEKVNIAVNASNEALQKANTADINSAEAVAKVSEVLEEIKNIPELNVDEKIAAVEGKIPKEYVKDATVSNDTLTITKQDGSTVEFQGGSSIDVNGLVTTNTAQTITGAKAFAGQVGNTQTEAGVYLGLDANGVAPNANIAITSANTAAYIDMGRPDVDYDFRIIKWNQPDNKHAQLVYGGNAVGTITIPQASGTMALTSDLANYLEKNKNVIIYGHSSDTPLYVRSKAAAAYIGLLDTNGTSLGYFGVNSKKKPVFYDTKDKQLAFLEEVKKIGTSNWNVSQSSSGNLVFEYK